jgi:hypothetical protein
MGMNDKLDVLWALTNLTNRIQELEDMLCEVLKYLDAEVDIVKGEDGEPTPNAAMELCTAIRDVMGVE